MFSTTANPTTRENIANVYSSKTLLALIPLELKLEMTPTTLPGQNAKHQSTQEDRESRKVRIQGHVSRPVVGEGRQTPDRQMFFVNSRPCALPQVSKVINEVYKSYNVTQSPFIFANLILDTNAYDVNVSPDKRTIMLHDQTALLEALKDALIQLFEEHNQSVPQAQLGAKKLNQSKPLNFMRQSPNAPEKGGNDQSPAPASNKEEEGADSSSGTPASQKAERTPVGLIRKSTGRDVTSRSRLPQAPTRKKSDEMAQKQKLMLSFQNETTKAQAEAIGEKDDEMQGEPSSRPQSPVISRAVQDFNDRISSLRKKAAHQERQKRSSESAEEGYQEPSIAAMISSSQKSSPGPVQDAFDRMRPKRASEETANITIGNQTTTMSFGRPKAKRRRIHTPKYDLNGGTLPSLGKMPRFVSSLRMFTALGTQIEEDKNEIEDGSDALGSYKAAPKKGTDSVSRGFNAAEEEPDEALLKGKNAETARHKKMDVNQLSRAESPLFVPQVEGLEDEYLDDNKNKAREDARVAELIAKAENAARLAQDNLERTSNILKGKVKKNSTARLIQTIHTSPSKIEQMVSPFNKQLQASAKEYKGSSLLSTTADQSFEERLSLTVSKSDFDRMRIIGQFNLGFILAVRPASNKDSSSTPSTLSNSDELFIIDQHASDEKINFERLTNTTIIAPQPLVHPHPLDLTAVEEEIILSYPSAFAANGFQLATNTSGEVPVGKRCRLLGLPVSKEMTFTVSDLEELIVLLNESSLSPEQANSIPRPEKVQRMLAMRACRSSVMIGKTLTKRQMKGIVEKMGEIDKPWNCPHGRPTMRHLASLAEWEEWREGDGVVGLGEGRKKTDWDGFMEENRKEKV